MKRTILLLLAILLWGGTSLLHAQAEAPFLPSAADARCKQWVDSVFSSLNLQEKSRAVDCHHLPGQGG